MGSATRHFIISPANLSGIRGQFLTRPNAASELAVRLRTDGVPLSQLFTFISSLYFRGKMAYTSAFAGGQAFVITGCGGLVSAETVVNLDEVRELYAVDFDPSDSRYRIPLVRDARKLLDSGGDIEVVLLGSIGTAKYTDPLIEVFGERLLFPVEFVGRGDMSRGGLMLRAAESGIELEYTTVLNSVRHGKRPAKLVPKAIDRKKNRVKQALASCQE
jgi:hypothetical protein